MLSAKQLCSHLCYMLHTPVRLFDAAGNCMTNDLVRSDQEDPLVCDPGFAAELLAMRRSEQPILHTEEHDTVYAVIPAEHEQTFLMGPFCYTRPTATASQTVSQKHHLKHPHAYHVSFLPLDYALEAISLLFHSGSEATLSRDDLAIMLLGEDYTAEVQSEAYSVIYQLRETDSAHNS